MAANTNPNLFRLSLPEWLKEQIDVGIHKGVYWINETEKIFHVPWKHASRNGWEDNDVSLFKSWAIYTNRYRDGIDIAKPALWKTNFRCAINSHNSIVFLKDQGQRKGDTAHRIMQLLDTPKKPRRMLHSNQDSQNEPPKKLVRLTFPSFNPQTQPPMPAVEKKKKSKEQQKISDSVCLPNECVSCNEIREQMRLVLEKLDEEENIAAPEILSCKAKFVEILSLNEHICLNPNWLEFITDRFSGSPEGSQSDSQSDTNEKANLNDLYNVGKALQSANEESSDEIRTEIISEEIVETINTDTSTVFIAYQNIDTDVSVGEIIMQENFGDNENTEGTNIEITEEIIDGVSLNNQDETNNENEVEVELSEEKIEVSEISLPETRQFYQETQRVEEEELIKPRD